MIQIAISEAGRTKLIGDFRELTASLVEEVAETNSSRTKFRDYLWPHESFNFSEFLFRLALIDTPLPHSEYNLLTSRMDAIIRDTIKRSVPWYHFSRRSRLFRRHAESQQTYIALSKPSGYRDALDPSIGVTESNLTEYVENLFPILRTNLSIPPLRSGAIELASELRPVVVKRAKEAIRVVSQHLV